MSVPFNQETWRVKGSKGHEIHVAVYKASQGYFLNLKFYLS